MPEPPRSRQARALAQAALVRLVTAYGETPEFVLLGGLVPDLLCSSAAHQHVGTTDVDVQVDLEIQSGAGNAARLERALQESGFTPSGEYAWRWRDRSVPGAVVKIEFLADMASVVSEVTVLFDGCAELAAWNLPGDRFRRTGLATPAVRCRGRRAGNDRRGAGHNPAGVPSRQGPRCLRPGPHEGLV
jgi:hypothetical protein